MEIQGNCKVSFAAVSSISVHQAHWHHTSFSYSHFRPAHVWEVKMGACWYWVLRLLISDLLLSGTQCHVASDEMHSLQHAKGGCPLLPLGRDFLLFSNLPLHQTGVWVSRKHTHTKPKPKPNNTKQNKTKQKKGNTCFPFKEQETSKYQNIYYFCVVSSHNYCFDFTAGQFFFFLVLVRNCWGRALSLESWGTTSHLPAPTEAGVPISSHPCSHVLHPSWPCLLVKMKKKAISLLKKESADFLTVSLKEEVKTKRRYDKDKDWFKGVKLGQEYPTRNFPGYNPRGAYLCLSPGLN